MIQRIMRGAGAFAGLVLVVLFAGTAAAERPFAVEGQITDRVGALGERRGAVQSALDQLNDRQQIQLFVVYVKDFSGVNPERWASETAQQSGFGRRDLVMAVATGARQYAVSADEDFVLSDGQIDRIASVAIEPALRQDDWAGAAIGAANGFDKALAGGEVTAPEMVPAAPDAGGSETSPLVWLIPVGAAGAAGAGAFLFVRSRRRPGPGAPRDQAGNPQPSLEELDGRAAAALVRADDAIKTSEQEVGFAQAQFGPEAAAPFAAAVVFAKEQLTAAFRLRQELDDEVPDTPDHRRAMLTEILARCEEADRRLDAESASFDRLRDLEANAPQVITEVEAAHRGLTERLQPADRRLAELGGKYVPAAFELVAGAPGEARSRLEFAATNLAEAGTAVRAGDGSRAAVHVRAAESAVGQAGQLLDGVERRAHELDEASAALEAALQDTTDDLATAQAAQADPKWSADLAPPIARAEAATAQVRQSLGGGPIDPIAELRRIQEANTALDEALAGVRDRQARERSAAAQLDQALLAARSEVATANDFIDTHRGAVGSTARTRLAEAGRQLDRAVGLASSDAVAALAAAEQAAALASQAGSLARGDVGGGPGRSSGGSMAGAVLGGILIESILSGGGGRGGGFGGGPTPGSFGGTGTRGRRGAGGRF